MRFYSTNLKSSLVSYEEALLQGQAPDKGLYLPVILPQIKPEELEAFRDMEYHEIAFHVIRKFVEEDLSDEALMAMCQDAYNFPIPLEKVDDKRYVMRLDQGPTASFKDFAARMMGRQMAHFLKGRNQNLLILTATSGDTGSAIANAFLGLENIKVVVLFPREEVTDRQRKQMTTLGQNIRILALDAKFDDCQALVKKAFSDPDLTHLNLSSANSINIGRLIPQAVYYFYAYSRLSHDTQASKNPTQPSPEDGEGYGSGTRDGGITDQRVTISPITHHSSLITPIIFSIPSGNFGDMMGGVIAMKMGLPVKRFVIAVNENDEFPHFLKTGIYQKIEPSRNCLSSAMNVGHPSNLTRLLAFYGGVMDEKGNILHAPDMDAMREQIWSVSITDEETRQCIRDAWENHKLLLEPHGAVGWAGLSKYLREFPGETSCISIETAHPAKFPDEINKLLGFDPALPPSLAGIEAKKEEYINIDSDYDSFKAFLLLKN